MRLLYNGKKVGRITTNHGMTIEEACVLCGIDLNEENNGDQVWDYELFSFDYLDEEVLKLTPTEQSIVDLIQKENLTNRQLGERLGIAEGTIRTHMGKILIKLNIKSRNELREI